MYAQKEKLKENKSRSIANFVAPKKSNVKQGFGFVDNRSTVAQLLNIQEIMNHYVDEQPQLIQRKEQKSKLNETLKSVINKTNGRRSVHGKGVHQFVSEANHGRGVIQYLMTEENFNDQLDLKSEPKQNEALILVEKNLTNYNKIDLVGSSLQDKLSAMNMLQRSIYSWFDLAKRSKMRKEHIEFPNIGLMDELIKETDEEHVTLVNQTRQISGEVPIDTNGMSQKDIALVMKLWKSIIKEKGNLKVTGSDEFKDRQYANIAKLLQGSSGRQLVQSIDKRFWWGNKSVTIGEDFANNPALKGEKQPEGSYTFASQKGQEQLLTLDEPTLMDELTEKTYSRHKEDGGLAAGIENTIRGGKHVGFQIAGENNYHRFNWGSNALLRMDDSEEGHSDLIDASEDNIINPEFITLGHELGHAMRMQRGTGLSKLGGTLGGLNSLGVNTKEDQERWTNPEEFVNITQVENPIRKEHGISERAFHTGSDVIEARASWTILQKDLRSRNDVVGNSLEPISNNEYFKLKVDDILNRLQVAYQKTSAPHEYGLDFRKLDDQNILRQEMVNIEGDAKDLLERAKEM